MGASRTLIRKLDLDLIARIEASGKPTKQAKSSKNEPRPASSYRQNGRPAKANVKGGGFRGRITLNRSENWLYAKSYRHAREIGPSSEPLR